MAQGKVVVMGGGPAGLSAALWLRNLGLHPLLVEREGRLGGMQNLNFLTNDWVLGQPGVTGPELCRRFTDHVVRAGIEPLLNTRVCGLVAQDGGFSVTLAQNQNILTHHCVALVMATGTRYRGAEVLQALPGFDRLPPAALIYGPYAFLSLEQVRGQRVLILGGGDNAFENARLVLEHGGMAHLVCRTVPRAQQVLRDAVLGRAGYQEFSAATLTTLTPAADGIQVSLILAAGAAATLTVDRIHVLAGYEPNTAQPETCCSQAGLPPLALDAQGYIVTDEAGRTSVPGIYAAGDVANPRFPNVLSAVAQGAQAAKTIELDLRNGLFFRNAHS